MSEMIDRLRELTHAVERLSDDADVLRQELRRRTFALWLTIIAGAVVLTVVVSAAFLVTLTNRQAIEDNNLRWCPIVALLVPREGDPPPSTEQGRLLVERATVLYHDFRCA